MMKHLFIVTIGLVLMSCKPGSKSETVEPVKPLYITSQVAFDSDDPAIWIHPTDPSKSLILGTDKMENIGGLYVFDLQGRMDSVRTIKNLDRPNNVDVAYGFELNGVQVDLAICTERGKGSIRIFSLPDLTALDGGGLPVFEDDTLNNKVMGVATYKREADQALFIIVSRKEFVGHDQNYLYQYQLVNADSTLRLQLIRKFGTFSGEKEIEAICVDAELGYIYYADESFGIRKYYADPEKGNEELAVFGTSGFADDREGISIYKKPDGKGYILVSDQGANQFQVYSREGSNENPHLHRWLATIPVTAMASDGSEVTAVALGSDFPEGMFVAMSTNKTFEIYDWRQLKSIIEPNK